MQQATEKQWQSTSQFGKNDFLLQDDVIPGWQN
jgi:hypothetical protein